MTKSDYSEFAFEYATRFGLHGDKDVETLASWYSEFCDIGATIEQLERAANHISVRNLRPFAGDHRMQLFQAVNSIMIADMTRAEQQKRRERDDAAAATFDRRTFRERIEAMFPSQRWTKPLDGEAPASKRMRRAVK